MTVQEQDEYWFKFHRFQMRHENIFTPKFAKAIQEQINQYKESGTVMAVTSTPIYKVLTEVYYEIPQIWAARSTVSIRNLKARAPIGFNQRIIELMKSYYGIDLLNDAEGITDTFREIIQNVLSDAAQNGWGFDEVVKRITFLNRNRARTIARTETVGAANAASNIAAKESGLVMDKIWISARDLRVRREPRDKFDHLHANGQTVGMNEKFIVSGEYLDFPGDRKGVSEGNFINCRCTHAFIPKRDANGRLIRL